MKTLDQYMSQPYPIEILPDHGGFIALLPDLPGCMSSGTTIEEAAKGLEEAKQLWLEGKLEHGEAIPEPTVVEDFSGKFVLRIPRSLHRALDSEARKQGVSLNQYLVHLISERHSFATLRDSVVMLLNQYAFECSKPRSEHGGWSWTECVHTRSEPGLNILFYTETHVQKDVLDILPDVPRPPRSLVAGKRALTEGRPIWK